MKNKSYENFFANFSNHTRMQIIGALMEKPMSVSEIVAKVGEEQSNVSHHLQHLTKCKILGVKKKGKQRIYAINKKTVNPMLKLVESHTYGCGGSCASCNLCK